ncbi:MAG: Gfo/Idh/MocA family oxidoreductase [Planctomycetota bacterium]
MSKKRSSAPSALAPAKVRKARVRADLGIAMVGHAFMGRAHANAIRQANHFFDLPYRLVPRVVVGRDAARAEAVRETLGFEEASADLDAVLARDDVHLVDIATPNDSHCALTLRALAAGKHVLCEKPLALTLDEARSMVVAAKKSKGRVGLWHNYRRCPAVSLAKRVIDRGDLGEVRHVRATYLQDWLSDPQSPASWRTSAKTCGSGAHGDLNAHLVDLTLFLTGLAFESVGAMAQTFTKRRPTGGGKTATVDVDDALAFLVRFRGGALGTFEATRVAPGRKNHNRIEINGSKGSLAWNFERMNELELFTFADAGDVQGFRTIMCMDAKHPYAANWWPDGHVLGYEHTFVHHLVDFVQAVATRKPFAPDFEDGFRVQAVLDAALRSAAAGAFVEVVKK